MLDEAVHLRSRDALAALACDFFQQRENSLDALACVCGDEHDGCVAEKLEIVTETFLISIAVAGAFAFAYARSLRRTRLFLLAAGHEIPFVDDNDHRPSALVRITGNGSVKLVHAFGRVDDQKRDV